MERGMIGPVAPLPEEGPTLPPASRRLGPAEGRGAVGGGGVLEDGGDGGPARLEVPAERGAAVLHGGLLVLAGPGVRGVLPRAGHEGCAGLGGTLLLPGDPA